MRIIGIVLVLLGVAALVYRGFTVTKEETKAEIGPIEIRATEKERHEIPVWAGVAVTLVGAALIAAGGRRGVA